MISKQEIECITNQDIPSLVRPYINDRHELRNILFHCINKPCICVIMYIIINSDCITSSEYREYWSMAYAVRNDKVSELLELACGEEDQEFILSWKELFPHVWKV